MAVHQGAVERARGGYEILLGLGAGEGGHRAINTEILNACIIAAARRICRFAAPIISLLIARLERGVIIIGDEVKIEILQSPLILAGIDKPHF